MPHDPDSPVPPPVGASPEERWKWAVKHARPRTDDDTPVLIGSGGRRATREEVLAFLAREQERIARGG